MHDESASNTILYAIGTTTCYYIFNAPSTQYFPRLQINFLPIILFFGKARYGLAPYARHARLFAYGKYAALAELFAHGKYALHFLFSAFTRRSLPAPPHALPRSLPIVHTPEPLRFQPRMHFNAIVHSTTPNGNLRILTMKRKPQLQPTRPLQTCADAQRNHAPQNTPLTRNIPRGNMRHIRPYKTANFQYLCR